MNMFTNMLNMLNLYDRILTTHMYLDMVHKMYFQFDETWISWDMSKRNATNSKNLRDTVKTSSNNLQQNETTIPRH